MSLNIITEKIHDLNIVDIIQSYGLSLKQKGVNYTACCPFHNEKTPSFMVNPNKGYFHCFGCDKSGDAIAFVMEQEKLSFWEAVTDIAKRFNLPLPQKTTDKQQQEFEAKQKKVEAYRIINEFAKDHFIDNLKNHKPEYIKNRISGQMAKKFEVGYAVNDWDNLRKTAQTKKYNESLLIDLGLLGNKNGKVYDRFRGRMIFPVYNFSGKLVGFSGRDITGNADAKYINSPESEIFSKGKELFGLFQAKKAITKAGCAYLVEGNNDVTTMHGIEIENTVAPLGTAFTPEQAKLIKRFTDTVVIITDGDAAGKKAAEKIGFILITGGLNAYVIEMPKDEDPDSFFTSKKLFKEYEKDAKTSYIEWFAAKIIEQNPDDPEAKARAVEKTCNILLYMSDVKANAYIDKLSKVIKPKKQWEQQLALMRADNTEKAENNKLPDNVDAESVEKYGFYEYKKKYYFRTREGGYYPISNFVLKPLFHIKLVNDSSRLFEMVNVFNDKEIIEIDIQSMVSIQGFRKVVESRGNYLFEGNDTHFMKLKRKLYDQTKTCELVEHLGWQKEGFFAFSNGIFNGKWTDTDNNGIVENKNRYYFIPALSEIYKSDKTLFLPERRFKLINRDITLKDWSALFIKVFGDSGRIAICFYLATLFKDFISAQFKFFPILNAFGPPGTGKSQMAWSLMYLFGEAQNPYNLHNGTKVGLAEHLSEFSNAFAWIDEYKNAVDYDKIEMLKSAYDLIGRKKGGIEKGRKTQVSTVNAGIIITGQEMPTADVALLKRVILLQFFKSEFSQKEQQNYDLLKDIEKDGLSHFSLEILKYRDDFEKTYFKVYDKVSSDLRKELTGVEMEDRIFRNVTILVAAFKYFEDKIDVNMSYPELLKIARQNVIDQSSFIVNSAEKRNFWDTIESAVENRMLADGQDYKIDTVYQINIEGKELKFETPIKIIYLKFSRIYEVYAETMRRTGQHPLPKSTLIFYLKTSNEFIGMKKGVRFDDHVTNGYIFNYEKLDLHLERVSQFDTAITDGDGANDEQVF